MTTVNSHNSNTYQFFAGLIAVLTFGILASSCNVPVTSDVSPPPSAANRTRDAVDLNLATASDLAELPGIGPKLARSIVDFRNRNGPFKRPEHIMLVPGMSETRFLVIRDLVRVSG